MKKKTIPLAEFTHDDVADLCKLPLPYRDNSVEEVKLTHVLSYIPGKQRGKFMDEIHRILKPEGKCTVIVHYYNGMRSIADFSVEWPPLCEMSFCYFNKAERERNKVHLDLKCDFDFNYGCAPEVETAGRAVDVQAFWHKRYNNTAEFFQVNMVKRK